EHPRQRRGPRRDARRRGRLRDGRAVPVPGRPSRRDRAARGRTGDNGAGRGLPRRDRGRHVELARRGERRVERRRVVLTDDDGRRARGTTGSLGARRRTITRLGAGLSYDAAVLGLRASAKLATRATSVGMSSACFVAYVSMYS